MEPVTLASKHCALRAAGRRRRSCRRRRRGAGASPAGTRDTGREIGGARATEPSDEGDVAAEGGGREVSCSGVGAPEVGGAGNQTVQENRDAGSAIDVVSAPHACAR